MKFLYQIKKFLEILIEFLLSSKGSNELPQGYTAIPNYLTDEQCEQIKSKINNFENSEDVDRWVDPEGADTRFFGIDRLDKTFKEAFFTSKQFNKVKDIFLDHTGREIENLESFVMAGHLISQETSLGSGGGWHRDRYAKRQLKLICYLSDVDDESGPFQFLDGSFTPLSKLKRIFSFKESPGQLRFEDKDIDFNNVKNICGKKGTLLLADTTGIHRGRPMSEANKERYAITLYSFEDQIPPHIEKQLYKANQ